MFKVHIAVVGIALVICAFIPLTCVTIAMFAISMDNQTDDFVMSSKSLTGLLVGDASQTVTDGLTSAADDYVALLVVKVERELTAHFAAVVTALQVAAEALAVRRVNMSSDAGMVDLIPSAIAPLYRGMDPVSRSVIHVYALGGKWFGDYSIYMIGMASHPELQAMGLAFLRPETRVMMTTQEANTSLFNILQLQVPNISIFPYPAPAQADWDVLGNPPERFPTHPSGRLRNYPVVVDELFRPVPGEDAKCAWREGSPFYTGARSVCMAEPAIDDAESVCAPDVHARNVFCHDALELNNGEVAYSWGMLGPLLRLRIAVRVIDPYVTPRGSRSLDTHNRGLGRGAWSAGNPFADCTPSTPCKHLHGWTNATLGTRVLDDHIGVLEVHSSGMLINTLAESAGLSATQIFVDSLSESARAEAEDRGLGNQTARVALALSSGWVVATTHGRAPFFLPESSDPVLQSVCTALGNPNATARYMSGGGGWFPASNLSRTTGDSCGLPWVSPGTHASGVDRPMVQAVTPVMWMDDWLVRAYPTALPFHTCVDSTAPSCNMTVWVVVAVPQFWVLHTVQALGARMESSAAAARSDAEAHARGKAEDARNEVLAVAVAIAAVSVVSAAVAMVFALRPVTAVADLIEAAATLDPVHMRDAMHRTLGAQHKASSPSELLDACDDVPTDKQAMCVGWDARADALLAYVAAMRKTSPLTEVAALQGAFASMATTLASLAKYVPEEVVTRQIASGRVASLGMEPRDTVVLFSDVANFTTICEEVPLSRLLPVMAEYFAVNTDCVHANGGAVDKFIGDAVMAMWAAIDDHPRPALAAVTCAVNMQGVVRRYRRRWLDLRVRVGINAGRALSGNIGSPQRFNYTIIGDVVNVASRLEAANKLFGSGVLMSDAVLLRDCADAERTEPHRRAVGVLESPVQTVTPRTIAIDEAPVSEEACVDRPGLVGQHAPSHLRARGEGLPPTSPISASFLLRFMGQVQPKGRQETLRVYDVFLSSRLLARAAQVGRTTTMSDTDFRMASALPDATGANSDNVVPLVSAAQRDTSVHPRNVVASTMIRVVPAGDTESVDDGTGSARSARSGPLRTARSRANLRPDSRGVLPQASLATPPLLLWQTVLQHSCRDLVDSHEASLCANHAIAAAHYARGEFSAAAEIAQRLLPEMLCGALAEEVPSVEMLLANAQEHLRVHTSSEGFHGAVQQVFK
eukprot:TRINITY_DN5882_c0_g2_i1.p1 TRINITY_DN5882_c0_g2~~TRINITY_DN5882_c0_g2_i1.p1  ORF type:complete len:1207 (+),score=264.66 TRINITY_DN5882_c0_g2_i1:118-3738(+)